MIVPDDPAVLHRDDTIGELEIMAAHVDLVLHGICVEQPVASRIDVI